MSNIKRMKDKDGNYIYPVTHVSAVFDDEGNGIDKIIANTSQLQTDYIKIAEHFNVYDNMYISKVSEESFNVILSNKENHMTYNFNKDGCGYYVQHYVYSGYVSSTRMIDQSYRIGDLELTGSFTTTSTIYTTAIGDTFTKKLTLKKGDTIYLQLYSRNDGGIWEILLNDQSVKEISTYIDETAGQRVMNEVYTIEDAGEYTLKGIFKGSDPLHETTNPRGWLMSSTYDVIIIQGEEMPDFINDITYCTPSNKDFAIRFKPVDIETASYFVPYHGTVTAAIADSPIVYNGQSILNLDDLSVGRPVEINSFTLCQHIYGIHPETTDTKHLEIWTNASISKNNILHFDGKMKVLVDTHFDGSFTIMGVAENSLFDACVTGFQNTYQCTASDNSQTALVAEHDKCETYAFISSENKNVYAAFRYNNIHETLRQGADDKPGAANCAYLQHRDENVLKLYNLVIQNHILPAGYILRFSGDFSYGIYPNIYNLWLK